MKNRVLYTLVFLGAFFCSLAIAADTDVVDHISDGDSFVLKSGKRVRLIGVDTPETHDSERNAQNARRNRLDAKQVEAFAQKAKSFLKRSLEGKEVRLEYDWQREDKYGRTLAYVYRSSDDLFVNAEIIREGYGFAYQRFPYKMSGDFERYAAEARAQKKGLWRS